MQGVKDPPRRFETQDLYDCQSRIFGVYLKSWRFGTSVRRVFSSLVGKNLAVRVNGGY